MQRSFCPVSHLRDVGSTPGSGDVTYEDFFFPALGVLSCDINWSSYIRDFTFNLLHIYLVSCFLFTSSATQTSSVLLSSTFHGDLPVDWAWRGEEAWAEATG